MKKLKSVILFFAVSFLASHTFAEFIKTEDQAPLINLSKPSNRGKAHLRRLYKISSPDIKNSNQEKAIIAADKIKSSSSFDSYTQFDRANLYAYVGWLYLLTKQYELATQNFSEAMRNYPVYSKTAKETTIQQLVIASTQTDKAEKVFDHLYKSHISNLKSVPDLLNLAELYSQQMHPLLSSRIYSLANKKSKETDDYDRYIYYASLIKSLALHGNKDALKQLAKDYQEEGKSIPWKDLLAWKSKSEHSYLPIERHAPVYPEAAFNARIEGYCDIEFSVDANGRTSDLRIIEEYPSGHFGKVSIQAAEKFKYRPFIGPDGKPAEKKNLSNTFIYLR